MKKIIERVLEVSIAGLLTGCNPEPVTGGNCEYIDATEVGIVQSINEEFVVVKNSTVNEVERKKLAEPVVVGDAIEISFSKITEGSCTPIAVISVKKVDNSAKVSNSAEAQKPKIIPRPFHKTLEVTIVKMPEPSSNKLALKLIGSSRIIEIEGQDLSAFLNASSLGPKNNLELKKNLKQGDQIKIRESIIQSPDSKSSVVTYQLIEKLN